MSIIFIIASFEVRTKRSASPLNLGLYEGLGLWTIPLYEKNSSISDDINEGPLSNTMYNGKPKRANISSNASMVASDVILFIILIKGYFEKASVTTKNVILMNGPAKLM